MVYIITNQIYKLVTIKNPALLHKTIEPKSRVCYTSFTMIKRYTRKKMEAIWSLENKFQKWLDIELATCDAHVELGNLKQEDVTEIKEKANFDIKRIDEIEAEIHHDVIAFLTSVAEFVGEKSRFVHLGLT